MKYFWFLILIVLVSAVSYSYFEFDKDSTKKNYSVNKYDKDWKKIHQTLDKKAASLDFSILSEKEITLQDCEVRVWVTGGTTGLRGVIIQKINNESSAFLLPVSENQDEKISVVKLAPPKDGWERVWANLENEDIFSLPDESEVHNPKAYNDGQSVFIESKYKGVYNIYGYSEPAASDIEQAKKVSNIIKIISNAFDASIYIFPEQGGL